jgi:hypothetical protein
VYIISHTATDHKRHCTYNTTTNRNNNQVTARYKKQLESSDQKKQINQETGVKSARQGACKKSNKRPVDCEKL